MGRCAGAAAALGFPRGLASASGARPAIRFPSDPRKRVAVAAYPFRDFLVGWNGWDGKTPSRVPAVKQVRLVDFAAHVVERFGVHNIEPWSPIFPSTEPKYLDTFRAAVEKAHSAVVDIAVDAEYSQYALDAAERERSAAASRHWIDVGAALGSPGIRTHLAEAKDSKPDVDRASRTFAGVAEYAAKRSVVVYLENDDSLSEDPFFIAQVIDKVDSPWLRALPDFGNSLAAHGEDFQNRAMETLFAHAYGICHVKDGEADDQGKTVHVDLAKTFAILKKYNFKGFCSIEYDAPGDPYPATAALIEKTVEFLS